MSATLTSPIHRAYFQTFQCNDTHQQAAMLQAWNQSYCQMSAGAFKGTVTEINTGAVRVIVERLNRAVLQRGALSSECIAVGVPLQLSGHAKLCGRPSHINGLHIFSGNAGFEFLSPEHHLVVDIELYPQRFTSIALRNTLALIVQKLGCNATVLDLPDERMGLMRQTLRTMLETVAASPALLCSPQVRDAFEKSLVSALSGLLNVDANEEMQLPCGTSRSWRLTQAARAHVGQAAEDCPLSVAELASTLNVSRRTLQYAFQDALGVNPATYLRAERLNRVRRFLDNATSVTEAATRFGFWHFGHFASEYRALFAELPSETFRRRRGSYSPEQPLTSVITPAEPGWLH